MMSCSQSFNDSTLLRVSDPTHYLYTASVPSSSAVASKARIIVHLHIYTNRTPLPRSAVPIQSRLVENALNAAQTWPDPNFRSPGVSKTTVTIDCERHGFIMRQFPILRCCCLQCWRLSSIRRHRPEKDDHVPRPCVLSCVVVGWRQQRSGGHSLERHMRMLEMIVTKCCMLEV